MSEELMENGVPQGEEAITQSEITVNEITESNQGDQKAEDASAQLEKSVDKVTDLSELAPKDGEFDNSKSRATVPFTVRMKVTQGAVVVTIKRVENDSTQTFFIPVRW